MNPKKINFFNIGLSLADLFFLLEQISKNRSYMRATHNLFLKKKITINNLTANLGSGVKNDYLSLITKKINLVQNFDFFKKESKTVTLDLEKKFNLNKKFKSIILFNVLEHIYNKDILIKSISKSLKKGDRLELFVPFMYKYHEDPEDYFRFTHKYLQKFLNQSGFKVKITLIATGQLNVILEILFKYLKFNSLKMIFAFIFIILNNIFKIFSKDFKKYYCGIHCSCIKLK